jgi:TPR repeat protein
MEKTIRITALSLSLILMGTVSAGWNDGAVAYEKKDFKTAFKEWMPLAEQGDAAAQNNLGLMYQYGEGVLENDKEAVKWYRKSAENGYAKAQNNLGVMHAHGWGVLKNMSQAKYWLQKAYEGVDKNATALAEKNWNEFRLWKY